MHTKQTVTTGIGVLTISLMLTSASAINGVIPQMQQALSISQSQSELLGTVPSLAVVVFILFSNWIVPRVGMKKTILAGLLLAGFGGILPIFAPNFVAVMISRLILGSGLGLYNALAVSYIGTLYSGHTKATLLGFRNAMESMGQTILIFGAGLLLNFSWAFSFAVYALALPIALIFYLKVPDVPMQGPQKKVRPVKLQPAVYGLVGFAIILVMNSNAISVRFASIAAQVAGDSFNASRYLALMPVLGILAGCCFGPVFKHLGNYTLYLSLLSFVAANLMLAISGHNLGLLLTGLFLSSLPCAWCFPYLFNQLDKVTDQRTVNLATALIFIGCNIGTFLAPIAMKLTQILTHSHSLTAPFYLFAVLLTAILAVALRVNRREVGHQTVLQHES